MSQLSTPSQLARSLRPESRLPGLPGLSINTWLIVINVAVYLLGATILHRPYTLSSGQTRGASVTDEQWGRRWVQRDASIWVRAGEGYHPIFTDIDANGRQVMNLQTGAPVPIVIGQDRFTVRPLLDALGHFSTGKVLQELQVWRFITFQFLHANLMHLAFNMIGLWFVGAIVEEYLGRRRYLTFYLTSGVMGGVSYLLLNLLGHYAKIWVPAVADHIPFLLVSDPYMPLVGASAGVFGVLLAAAFIAPQAIVEVFFIIPMRLRTAVYLFLGIAVVNLFRGGGNAGGDAAHVGGAIAGFYLVRNTHRLRDILSALGIGEHSRHDRARAEGEGLFRPSTAQREQEEIDRIIRKAREHGLGSITPEDRRKLRDFGERVNAL